MYLERVDVGERALLANTLDPMDRVLETGEALPHDHYEITLTNAGIDLVCMRQVIENVNSLLD